MNEQNATTIEQLGGFGKLSAMLGAHGFTYDNEACRVSFKFKGSRKANAVTVTYDRGADLYNVTIYKLARFDVRTVLEVEGLDTAQMRETFERTTGLYLSL